MTTFERESVEFLPVTITVDGVVATSNVTFCLTPEGVRPVTFATPASVAGKTGIMVSGLAPGVYRVWAKVTSTPEIPVLNCGYITIS